MKYWDLFTGIESRVEVTSCSGGSEHAVGGKADWPARLEVSPGNKKAVEVSLGDERSPAIGEGGYVEVRANRRVSVGGNDRVSVRSPIPRIVVPAGSNS
jgi:hypothetical protein